MPGPAPKLDERRQRTNTPRLSVIPFDARTAPLVPPSAPRGWLTATRAMWKSFWKSSVARAVAPETDMPAILRLFSLNDERERAYRAYRRERLVTGSQGQRVLNPMGRAMREFDAEIRQLEDRLGLTPRARLQLGITFGEAAKTLAELNRALNEDSDDEKDDTDPRQ